MEIQLLRDTTYIFLEQSIILTTIEDLLWQAGQKNLLLNLLNIEKLAPQSLPPDCGAFFYLSGPVRISHVGQKESIKTMQ